MSLIPTSNPPAYLARRVRIYEEWNCPQCGKHHFFQREAVEKTVEDRECVNCGYSDSR